MKTNVKIENLELYKHADQRVAIIVANGTAGFESVLEVFMTNDALKAWLKEKREKHPDTTFNYVEDYLGTAVNYAIWNDVEGMSMHSRTDTSFDITREDLTKLAQLFDTFGIMNRMRNGRMSMAEACDSLKRQTVYYIGNDIVDGKIDKKDMVFGKTMIGESIAAFFTLEGALSFAGTEANVPVSNCRLWELAAAFGYNNAVVLEPERSFTVTLPAEGLRM